MKNDGRKTPPFFIHHYSFFIRRMAEEPSFELADFRLPQQDKISDRQT